MSKATPQSTEPSKRFAPTNMNKRAVVATASPVGGEPVDVQNAAPTMPRAPPARTTPWMGETLDSSLRATADARLAAASDMDTGVVSTKAQQSSMQARAASSRIWTAQSHH